MRRTHKGLKRKEKRVKGKEMGHNTRKKPPTKRCTKDTQTEAHQVNAVLYGQEKAANLKSAKKGHGRHR